METRETWRGLTIMLATGLLAGVANVLLFLYVMNPLAEAAKEDEVAISTYAINLFVGWVFFSAWFLSRADDELKKVEEAVHKKDKALFLLEAPKTISLSIRILYLIICFLTILAFHLFRLFSTLVSVEIQFGIGFLVVTTAIFLWDLDEPVGGVVEAKGIPDEWKKELREAKESGKMHP